MSEADPPRPTQELRKGWTTGACAAAAAKAAWIALTTGRFPAEVTITLPRGQRPSFAIERAELGDGAASAGIIKDAGDDPDVTHGAMIIATITGGEPGAGVAFRAGAGVGTITRPGLPLPPGEPAINPAPRRMIAAAIAEANGGVVPDVIVTISIPGGDDLARRTLNARLGIVGGLSVLGTTGIVIPYSCASWIHSIHRGIDVARAMGLAHIAAATGSTSEQAVQKLYDLPETALIDMGDFAGGTLKYLRGHPVPRLTIAGGFAKLVKLAQGHLDLHSDRSRVDQARLAAVVERLGGAATLCEAVAASESAGASLTLASDSGIDIAAAIAAQAREVARATLPGSVAIDVVIFNRQGRLLGRAGP